MERECNGQLVEVSVPEGLDDELPGRCATGPCRRHTEKPAGNWKICQPAAGADKHQKVEQAHGNGHATCNLVEASDPEGLDEELHVVDEQHLTHAERMKPAGRLNNPSRLADLSPS